MKISHITTVHPKNDNRIFFKECKTLKNQGHEVSLIVAGEEDQEIDGIKIYGIKKKSSRLKRFFSTSFFGVLKVEKRVKAQVYHFHDPELIFAGLILKLKGKKVIYDIHENNSASILSKPYIKNNFLKTLISKSFNLLEKSVIPFFDAIVTARPDITEKFSHKKIITLRNFPILSGLPNIINTNYTKDKKALIFVGYMTELRGINILVDAFKEMPNYELWLLGSIAEQSVKNKVENSSDNVKYFGVVEPYKVFEYILKADAGIITFLPVANHIKTLATKPFEYMACGKPMIMSNFDYWKSIFKDSSLYVDPNNKIEIIKATKKLFSDKNLCDKMGKENLKLSQEKYNWDKESKKLISLYETLY